MAAQFTALDIQLWFWLSIMSPIFFGITGITQRPSANLISFDASFAWFCPAMFLISGIVAITVLVNWRLNVEFASWAALGSLLNGLGTLASFAPLGNGEGFGGNSNYQLVSACYWPARLGSFWERKLARTQGAGIGLALAGRGVSFPEDIRGVEHLNSPDL